MIAYNKEVLNEAISSGRKIYIYFYLEGCGPCKSLTPKVKEFSKYNEVYGVRSNDDPELKTALQATSYPSLVILENQVISKNVNGVNSIKQVLAEYGKSNQ